MNRCARKIGDGEEIRDVPTYCIGIARMLLREMSRETARQVRPLEEAPEPRTMPPAPEGEEERRVDCLRRCLEHLPRQNRDLILHYYQGEKGEKIKNRKRLMDLFGIPHNTLRMRALRVRERLQLCSENCLQRQGVIRL